MCPVLCWVLGIWWWDEESSHKSCSLVGKKDKRGVLHTNGEDATFIHSRQWTSAGPEVTTFRSDFVQSILIGSPHLVPRLEMVPQNRLPFSLESKTLWSSVSFLLTSRFPKEQEQGLNDEQSLKCHWILPFRVPWVPRTTSHSFCYILSLLLSDNNGEHHHHCDYLCW